MDSDRAPSIDLHIHSTASDGTLTPAEILTLAQKLNLAAISITDHDTIDGARAALKIGIPDALDFLTGVEISTNPPPAFAIGGSLHLLGYAIDVNDDRLNRALSTLQKSRKDRTPKILARLNTLGIDLSIDEIRQGFGDVQTGRPQIARALVRHGHATTIDQAFHRYLGHGRPAYVDKYRIDCAEAIRIILQAGGIPVLAHPSLIGLETDARVKDLITVLKAMGLKGVEAYYPEHSARQTAFYAACADRQGLLITGGSDFHGDIKPDIQMGSGYGDLRVPYRLYRNLINSG